MIGGSIDAWWANQSGIKREGVRSSPNVTGIAGTRGCQRRSDSETAVSLLSSNYSLALATPSSWSLYGSKGHYIHLTISDSTPIQSTSRASMQCSAAPASLCLSEPFLSGLWRKRAAGDKTRTMRDSFHSGRIFNSAACRSRTIKAYTTVTTPVPAEVQEQEGNRTTTTTVLQATGSRNGPPCTHTHTA
jgi:hypothetical protein